jgi:hypothetical protein
MSIKGGRDGSRISSITTIPSETMSTFDSSAVLEEHLSIFAGCVVSFRNEKLSCCVIEIPVHVPWMTS